MLKKIIILLLAVTFLLMGILAFPYFDVKPEPSYYKVIFIVLILLLFYIFFEFSKSNISNNLFISILFFIGLTLRVLWVFMVPTELTSDFQQFFLAAEKFSQGNFEVYKNSRYYTIWPANLGFSLVEGILLFLVKNLIGLKILFALVSSSFIVLLYKIGKRLYNNASAKIIACIVTIFPPFIFYTSVNTNQTLSILFVLLAFHFFVSKKSWVFIGVFLSIAHFIRPTAIIFWVGFIAYLVFVALPQLRKTGLLKKTVFSVIKVSLGFWGTLFIINTAIIGLQIHKEGVFHDPVPKYKFLVGLNPETKGRYSAEDAALTQDIEIYNQKVDRLIQKRIENKSDLPLLFAKKYASMWSSGDDGLFWATKKKITLSYHFFFQNVTHAFYLLLLLFSAIGLWIAFFNKNHLLKDPLYYFLITFFGFIIVYLFIEIQTRYRYEIYPLIILLAGEGIFLTLNRMKLRTKSS